jgi:hypothetical protein
MRILPHQGARHSTVDHGDASDGVFLLLHLWVLPSRRAIHLANDLLPLLSLACRRPLWRMGLSLSLRMAAPSRLRVEESSRARKRGAEPTPEWAKPVGHPDPVRSPLRSCGSSCIYALCPSICTILMMSSSRPRWRFSLHEV